MMVTFAQYEAERTFERTLAALAQNLYESGDSPTGMKVVSIETKPRSAMSVVEFPQLIDRGCGLDVHKDNVAASIRGEGLVEETRTFLTFNNDLEELTAW